MAMSRFLLLLASAATLETGSDLVWPPEHPDWAEWKTVAGGTTCFRGTSCAAHYSSTGMGCCPYEGAVCCPNGQTCCPSGTSCQDSGTYLTTCMKGATAVGAGLSVCKPGAAGNMSMSLPNVLIIGDSVSIGYTMKVAAIMKEIALVQHSPLDGGDGGAEETAYGLQCLDYFLRSPEGELLKPDVIMFNWGLHDGPLGNDTVPGQSGSPDVYGAQLANITKQLIAKMPQAKLLFALTSPSLCDVKGDGSVVNLNNQAAAIMAVNKIPTINLHDAIVKKCGPVPQSECFGVKGCFCPHCSEQGYDWLATSTIAPALTKLLPKLFAYV